MWKGRNSYITQFKIADVAQPHINSNIHGNNGECARLARFNFRKYFLSHNIFDMT